eukprot:CAMPEP_0119546712 /NCGR_PEP_ID=MMETSP1352-20130426/1011_1 /TAXON_ID=265584 /ORGANISM="Stauroneis constricta, Strain CCMP1120" /LENGTH=148 /DNA_ID=CAMNT_0007591437 /DNA_START=257 /DNA_END=703 /DNA_ORIENTATION=-
MVGILISSVSAVAVSCCDKHRKNCDVQKGINGSGGEHRQDSDVLSIYAGKETHRRKPVSDDGTTSVVESMPSIIHAQSQQQLLRSQPMAESRVAAMVAIAISWLCKSMVCPSKCILGEVYGDGIALITVQTTLRQMVRYKNFGMDCIE